MKNYVIHPTHKMVRWDLRNKACSRCGIIVTEDLSAKDEAALKKPCLN